MTDHRPSQMRVAGNESAFPTNFEATCETCKSQMLTTTPHPGLTKREYFAVMALQGLLACPHQMCGDIDNQAALATEYADRLLKELSHD